MNRIGIKKGMKVLVLERRDVRLSVAFARVNCARVRLQRGLFVAGHAQRLCPDQLGLRPEILRTLLGPALELRRCALQRPCGEAVQSASVLQLTVVSVPVHATTPVSTLHVTGCTRCTVPSGQRENPEGWPSLVSTSVEPAHSGCAPPPELVVVTVPVLLPPPPPLPPGTLTFPPHAVRPIAARIEVRTVASEGMRAG